jgi:hypothetical protein
MTRISLVALSVAACLAASACSGEPAPAGELRPGDFARGAAISAPGDQPFFMLQAPDELFTETAWPDQRDVRVFNASGAMVPFARISSRPAAGPSRRVPLRSFRLEGQAPGGEPVVELDTRGQGLQLRVTPTSSGDTVEYLLALEPGETQQIRALHFTWEESDRNWQQQVTVSVGRNLNSWTPVAASRPLMDLRAGDQRLRHSEVPIDRVSPDWARYWRLRFAPGFMPALTGVEAEVVSDPIEAPPVSLVATPESSSDGSLVVQLPTPQPVAWISVYPAEANSVIPLTIEGRRGGQPWRHIRTAVAYRIQSPEGEQTSPRIAGDGSLVDAMRLKPFGTSWGAAAPSVSLERPGLILVVNARGAGPFLIAWGSRAANESAIDLATLLPDSSPEAIAQLPSGGATTRQELGGPSRLTEQTPAERASRTQTMMVWALLVAGALALMTLAIKVYKEASIT